MRGVVAESAIAHEDGFHRLVNECCSPVLGTRRVRRVDPDFALGDKIVALPAAAHREVDKNATERNPIDHEDAKACKTAYKATGDTGRRRPCGAVGSVPESAATDAHAALAFGTFTIASAVRSNSR